MDRVAQLIAIDQTLMGLDQLRRLDTSRSQEWLQQWNELEGEKQRVHAALTNDEKAIFALRDATAEFQRRRADWLNAIDNNDDTNSVHSQISRMLWREAVMRCVSKSLDMVKSETVPVNAAVFEMMRDGYFVEQMMTVRRLADEHFKFEDESKGVLSLYGVVINMKKHRHLFTRASMLRAEEVAYDYRAIFDAEHPPESYGTSGVGSFRAVGNWIWPQKRQETIDKLCGVREDARRPDDTIKDEIFNRLTKRLANCSREIVKFTNKYLAHSANKTSRDKESVSAIRAKYLWHAQRVIVETSDFITVNLLGKNQHGGLAVPQYDVFEHIDKPMVRSKDVRELDNTWREFNNEVGNWTLEVDTLLNEKLETQPAMSESIPNKPGSEP